MTIVFGSVDKTAGKALWKVNAPSREVVAFCPGCKAMETLTCNNEGIVPRGKFSQKGTAVFHGCASKIPCRLYSLS
jgi:hypothetical protein